MKNIVLSSSVEKEIQKVSKAAKIIWNKGWAERNGGNISINITKMIGNIDIDHGKCEYVSITKYPKELSERIFFVTGTGKRIRDLEQPDESACIIKFDTLVNGYHILWGGSGTKNFRPTSELISHAKIHTALEKSQQKYTTVLHSHPTEIICLSHHPALSKNEEYFNNTIWSMLPEIRLFVPRGVALLPYTLPGSEALANMTVEGLGKRDVVVWLKHGALAVGRDVMEALDFLDVVNKGCDIYMKCLASGFTPIGLTLAEMNELAHAFRL